MRRRDVDRSNRRRQLGLETIPRRLAGVAEVVPAIADVLRDQLVAHASAEAGD